MNFDASFEEPARFNNSMMTNYDIPRNYSIMMQTGGGMIES